VFKKLVLLLIGFIFLLSGKAAAVENDILDLGHIEGYLMKVDRAENSEAKILIKTYGGNSYEFGVSPDAVFTIDDIPVMLEDFRVGMEIFSEIQNGEIVCMESYSTAVPGYISPASRVVTGVVKDFDEQQVLLQLTDGQEGIYYFSPATIIMKEGSTASLDILYEGDRVKLYFDEAGSHVVSQLKIEGDSILVRELYRGQLSGVDTVGKTIALQNVQVFRNGKWQEIQPLLQIPYIYELSLSVSGQKVPQHQLRYYQGNTVYLVTRELLGIQVAEKMAVKTYYEVAFTDEIDEINWFSRELETKNRVNLAFNSGTIVIKNGRLQDEYSLGSGDDAYIVADIWGSSRMANIVYVFNQDVNNSSVGEYGIYAGRLDQILQDRIRLDDCFVLDNNEWDSSSEEKELFYGSDTSIYDLEEGRFIDCREFYAGDYAVDGGSRWARYKDLEDYYAYVYANGNYIVSMNLQKEDIDSLGQQRASTGIFDSIENDFLVGWVASARDSCDWSSYKEQWLPRYDDLKLSLENAMIIKNNRVIMPEDLKTEDRFYMIRDDYSALIVIVK